MVDTEIQVAKQEIYDGGMLYLHREKAAKSKEKHPEPVEVCS